MKKRYEFGAVMKGAYSVNEALYVWAEARLAATITRR